MRDACEKVDGKYIEMILEELADSTRESNCKDVAKDFLNNDLAKILFDKPNTSEFVNHVFEGKNIPIYKRDIFFDAFPIHSFNTNQKFLSNDYIAPHNVSPLKNPIPVQFLKVLPKVVFKFEFKLTDEKMTNEIMPAVLKEELFKQILLDLGIGAKTNVGYGQFRMPTKTENETIKNSTTDTVGIQNVIQTQNDSPIIIIAPTPSAILNRIQDNWITKFNKPIGEYYEGSFVSNFGGNKMFKFNGITISYKNTDLGDVNKETPILMKITETMILNHDLKFELKIKSENDIIVDNEPIIVFEKELVEDKNEDLLTIKIEKTVEIPISEEEQRITIAPSFEYTTNWAEVKTDCIVKTIVKTSRQWKQCVFITI
ncbi:MAG: type III-B CRISPR module RAMP protein Cmr6 [Bacteroidetes bacterium]|nr:type III-B CRISPR module RAMP protein Cmr6 [Bacteroidota bacterium]